jgi:hypothetical protein
MLEPVSPWSGAVDRLSPDGRYRAVIAEAAEIAMGAPSSGALVISDNSAAGRVILRLEACNPSLVWASDSRALAVPQWTPARRQQLCIISVPGAHVRSVADDFRVLELHAFDHHTIRGIDSPLHEPRAFAFSVRDLIDSIPRSP